MKEHDLTWEPHAPVKQQQDSPRKRKRVTKNTGKAESNNDEILDDLKTNRKTRQRMKRHRPKVLNENKHIKTPKPSTPELKTPKPPRQVRKKVNNKRSCKRKLEFDEEVRTPDQNDLKPQCSDTLTIYVIAESPKIFKKKRKIRKRLSVEKLLRLLGIIGWINLKRRRSRMRHTRRQDLSCFLLKGFQVVDTHKPVEQCEHPRDNVVGSLPYQDDAVQEALTDFAIQKMESLRIFDGFDELVVHDTKRHKLKIDDLDGKAKKQLVKRGKMNNQPVAFDPKLDENMNTQLTVIAPKHSRPRVDIDKDTDRVMELFHQGVDDTESNTFLEKERELFVGRVNSFNATIRVLLGDRHFTRWDGSAVDSVVGVFLTQNVSDNLSSDAFMNLAATYPPPSLREQNGDYAINYIVQEPISPRREESNPNTEVEIDVPSSTTKVIPVEIDASSSTTKATPGRKNKKQNIKNGEENWDNLRIRYSDSNSRKRGEHNVDTIDWKEVREASVDELAKVIERRGMHHQLAQRIKNFLDLLVRDHGSLDLEWLRNVPPLKAKSYLMSISGLALKSTECVRLLSLYQPAFPIDVNVGRVLVRLGWVKLEPLPEGILLHQLNDYPELSKVQKYIWPRISNRNAQTLYEFHCYMNIFSKAFCTKTQPNCNACPMKKECKHYASALASSRLILDGSEAMNETSESTVVNQETMVIESAIHNDYVSEDHCEPILEFPPSPEPEITEPLEEDIENFGCGSEMHTIILNSKEMSDSPLPNSSDGDIGPKSKSVFDLITQSAQFPLRKVKIEIRLRTEHQVYELPDSHPLLAGFERRHPKDPCPYLLAIWTTDSCQEPKKECDTQGVCSSEIVQHRENEIVKGTILIPCRTANRGRFPLNGTYFQINEVFADHHSSREPIDIPRAWIWNLWRPTLFCGTSITQICKGMSLAEISYCLKEGYICIRGFDVKTRKPKILARRFHFCKTRQTEDQ
ncbi:hypothetical protein ACS0TY_020690 [Phlomoides rotata]